MAGPQYRQKLQPRNFEARARRDYSGPPGQPSSGLHRGYGGGQRPAVSYSSERGGPSDEYLKNPMGGGYEPRPFDLNIGLGALEKGKDIYNKFNPEINDGMLNFNLGNWNFGLGRDKIGFGYSLPLGGASMRPFKEGIESLTDSPDYSDFYMDKIIRDNPEEVLYNLMRQNPTPEMQEYYDKPIDRYQLDFGGPEIDRWISENPGSTMGDLLDILPELGKTGPQPGDFWPGGAEI